MKEIEFNLLEEPWIRVLRPDCTLEEVSLRQALLQAQTYSDLAGELPTQDVAVLRLLLAVLHAVFGRVDAQGQPVEIKNTSSAVRQWRSLWQLGHFPEGPIQEYLDRWHDRFWLFHPERPFWQVPEAEIGIEFDGAKLNGEISQSGNKKQLFCSFSGVEKESLSYAAAARWLLYINGYDERGGRPKAGNKPRHGVAWLGEIGFVAVKGNNLFETLMRNFALLQDGEKAWAQPSPLWEQKEVKIEQSTEIPIPNNQAEMLTLQSRRIILKRENDRVTGHVLLGGDYISSENAFAEQMTIWRQATKRDLLAYYPKQHDATKQMWREFPTFFEGRSPGVLRWNVLLQKSGALDRKEAITLWVVSNQYDSQQASLKDTFSDALSLHLAAFAELGFKRKIVVSEIHRCEQFADALGKLANDLALAAGGSEQDVSRSAKEQFYFRIDQPFRRWLYSIDPDWDEDETDASLAAWLEQAKKIVYAMGNQLVEEAGPAAFVGRMVKKKEGKKETSYRCAAPIASNKFASRISMIEKKGGA